MEQIKEQASFAMHDSTKMIVSKQEALIVKMQSELDYLHAKLPFATIEKIWVEENVYNGNLNKTVAGIYDKLNMSKQANIRN